MNEIADFEIFRAGNYGKLGSYSENNLEEIASTYNNSNHEAPITLGHPQRDNEPAYGWIKKLYRKGKSLFANGVIVPELTEWIKHGFYRKASAGLEPTFYKDFEKTGKMSLNHVALLGAVPPVIKGMEGIQGAIHAFADSASKENFVVVRFADDEKIKTEVIQKMSEIMFSEAQVNDRVTAELAKRESALRLEFSEALTKKDAEIATLRAKTEGLEAQVSEFSEKSLRAEIEGFIETLIKDGKLIPASKDKISASLLKLAKTDSALFAEQKEIYAGGPKLIEFSENKSASGDNENDGEVARLVGKENADKYGRRTSFSFGR